MANIVFKVGTLDLSSYLRVNPNEHLNLGQGDMLEPAFSDSPFYEGQILTSIHAKNKELQVPLFLHPPTAPYSNDNLNQLVQQVNQALRPVVDLGLVVNAEWRNAQAAQSTFFTIQYGRFEPDFNFRISEKGWLGGILHLWVLPYGHTATERSAGTYSAPANQSGLWVLPSAIIAGATTTLPTSNATGYAVTGDVAPQFDLRVQVGSYLGDDGRLGIIAALPVPSYTPIIPVGSFIGLSPSAVINGASGAWASQFMELDRRGVAGGAGANAYFSFALSPASVYAGDNRVLGLVRARNSPFGLRAFDPSGQPIGPTAIASALDGWQLIDYGVLRVPPWTPTAVINIQAYGLIPYNASGQFAPVRAAPAWTKEHGPIFVVPNGSTLFDLDWSSPVISIDGFDATASTAWPAQDQLGNTWQTSFSQASGVHTGSSALQVSVAPNGSAEAWIGSPIVRTPHSMETIFTLPTASQVWFSLMWMGNSAQLSPVTCFFNATGAYMSLTAASTASVAIPSFMAGQWHLQLVTRDNQAVGNNGIWTARLSGPSGAYPGSASGVPLTLQVTSAYSQGQPSLGAQCYGGFFVQSQGGTASGATVFIEAFRSRLLASQGYQPADTLRLYQPIPQNTRQNPSGVDIVDLQTRQRGAVQAPFLPVPSLGSGLFVASFPWDQGPANDVMNVDLRLRERFTYAR